MGKRMVTIASFDQSIKARMAEAVLKDVGIPVTVADETIVAMDWLLSNAVGGIKVQVWEEDAERAVAALKGEFGEKGDKFDPIDEEQLAAEAEAAGREDADEELPQREEISKPMPVASPPEPLSEQDVRTRSVVFLGWFSIPFWPLSFYALYRLLKLATGPEQLTPQGKYNLCVAGMLLACPLIICLAIIWTVLSNL